MENTAFTSKLATFKHYLCILFSVYEQYINLFRFKIIINSLPHNNTHLRQPGIIPTNTPQINKIEKDRVKLLKIVCNDN